MELFICLIQSLATSKHAHLTFDYTWHIDGSEVAHRSLELV